jgi:hypothetical protein
MMCRGRGLVDIFTGGAVAIGRTCGIICCRKELKRLRAQPYLNLPFDLGKLLIERRDPI